MDILTSQLSDLSTDKQEQLEYGIHRSSSTSTLRPSPSYHGDLIREVRAADKNTVTSLLRRSIQSDSEGAIAERRLRQEFRSFFDDEKTSYLSIVPINDAWDNCLACIEGPPNTAYERGVFWIHVRYPAQYPHKPPKMKFITPIYHPNFDMDGTIDLDFLADMWSPINTMKSCLVSILSVFGSPLVSDRPRGERNEAYEMWTEDYESYFEIARIYTEDCALEVRPDTTSLLPTKKVENSPLPELTGILPEDFLMPPDDDDHSMPPSPTGHSVADTTDESAMFTPESSRAGTPGPESSVISDLPTMCSDESDSSVIMTPDGSRAGTPSQDNDSETNRFDELLMEGLCMRQRGFHD